MPLTSVDWHAIREEFPSLKHWTYLNTASYGLVPARARRALDAHFDHRDEFACQNFLKWFDNANEIRGLLGKLIHCEADDVAFIGNSCTALSWFLNGIEWNEGDRIVTLDHDFPNQYAFPRHLGKRGVELVEISDLNGSLPERTRALVASTVSYTTGRRNDSVRLRRLADEAGAVLYLDGTQSIGALCFDVRETRPDMLAVDAYKWMLSPNGAGFFYISPDFRRKLEPQVIGWRSDRDWRSVTSLHNGAPRFSGTAEQYEGGMINFPSIYAMGETVRMFLELGPESIERRIAELSSCMARAIERTGGDVLHAGSNILSAGWPGRDMDALAEELKESRILAAVRLNRLRVSVHFYNTEEDIEVLARRLS